MAIGGRDIMGIAFRIISNRNEIAEVWDRIKPLIKEIRGRDPANFGDLVDDIVGPKGELEEGKQQPVEYDVAWLQESLNKLGADPQLLVDGNYGDATKNAVMDFQAKHPPLVVDGWAGAQTQAAIVEDLAKL